MMDFFRAHAWILIAIVAHLTILGTVAYLILLERKVASWVQDRIGPNRVGPWGLLQPIADGLKFILKEDYRPKGVDRVLFTIAPGVMILVVIISIAVLPWGGVHQVTRTIDVTGASNPEAAALARVPSIAEPIGKPQLTLEPGSTVNGVETPARTTATITYRYAFQIAQLNIGVLFILAVLSLAVYGVVIGGL